MLIALFAYFAQVAPSAPSDPFGPVVDYLLSFGILGAIVVGAMFGRVDLRPSAMRQLYEDQKQLNRGLVAGMNDQVMPALESSSAAVHAAVGEIALLRTEVANLRLEVARLKGPV